LEETEEGLEEEAAGGCCSWFMAKGGMRRCRKPLAAACSSKVKLNKAGKAFPEGGSLALGSRNSSKNGCAHTSHGFSLVEGVYCNTFEIRSMASGGTALDLKTLGQGCGFISGNL
jgi:hypothetical protein